MRGAEPSKQFMSYEIYFELEYHYLWSNCNGRSLGEKKNHGTLVPEPYIFIRLFLRKKYKFYMRGAESSKWFMSYEITLIWNIITYEVTATGGREAPTIITSYLISRNRWLYNTITGVTGYLGITSAKIFADLCPYKDDSS